MSLRGLGIASARLGDFSPHLNVGYQYRGRFLDNDAFLLTAGFNHLLAPWATLAGDLITEFEVGTAHLTVPPDVVIEAPFRRVIHASSIPRGAATIVERVARHQALAAAAGDVSGQCAVPIESRGDAARRALDAGRR